MLLRPTADAVERHARRRLVLGGLALASTVAGLGAALTGAYFTDTASVGQNTFTSGTVTVSTTPTSTAITMTDMAPGDVVTSPLTVRNSGTLALRYAILSTTDATDGNFLASQLELIVRTDVTSCTTADFAASGTVLYGPGILGTTAGHRVVGDAAPGQQAGDQVLAAGASQSLCLQVRMPSGTDNRYQNRSVTAVLRVDAEQTRNNP